MEESHEYVHIESIPEKVRLFELLFKISSDYILFFNKELQVVNANSAFLKKIASRDLNDIVGKNCADVFLNSGKNMQDILKNVFAKGEVLVSKHSNIFADDDNSEYEITSYPLRLSSGKTIYVANYIRDISERAALQKRLDKYNKQLELLHEIGKSMYQIINLNELLKIIIQGIVKLGYDDVALYGLNEEDNQIEGIISTNLSSDTIKKVKIPIKRDNGIVSKVILNKEKIYIKDVSNISSDTAIDNELYLHPEIKSLIAVPLIIGDKIIGLMTVSDRKKLLDLDDRDIYLLGLFATNVAISINRAELYDQLVEFNKKVKEKVEIATRETKEANLRLNELDKMKSQLLSIVSHEWRTPLTNIKGYASLFQAEKFGPLTEKQRNYLEIIISESDKLKEVVTDVINLSRLVSEKEALNLEVFDLSELIDEVVNKYSVLMDEKKIKFNKKYSPGIKIIADVDKIELALKHIISNAIKFNKQNGFISVNISNGDNFIQVDIEDTGIGIPSEHKDQIFDDFFQLEEHMTRVGQGTGIGLSIVKQVVSFHGGDVWVESVPSEFTRFSFSIPKDIKLPKWRKKQNEYVRALNELEAIRTISKILPQNMDLNEVLQLILESIKEIINFDRIRLYLLTDDRSKIVGAASVGNVDFEGVELYIKDDILLDKILSSNSARVYSKYENTKLNEKIGLTNFNPFVAMPLIIRGKILGVIAADNSISQRIIPKKDLESLTAFGNQAAIVIANARVLKETEKEVQRRTKELKEKNIELKKINQTKNEFLNYVSHELRTPLTSLIGYSKLLLNKNLSESQNRKGIEIISHESERLKRMIDDLLDISKIEAGKMEIRKIPSDLQKLVSDVIALMRPQADSKGIELKIFGDKIKYLIDFDREKIKQVLLNLLSNAVKFTFQGHVSLIVTELDSKVQITVEDTGVGIAEEDFPKVFDKFTQIQHDFETVKGTGLGMPITKLLVEAHGGEIWFESEKGKGSKFHFTISR